MDGCQAFDQRSVQIPPEPLFAQLTPEVRVRLFGWFIIAGPLRSGNFHYTDFFRLNALIEAWATSTTMVKLDFIPSIHHCKICGVSQWLDPWITTMLEVYSVDHLASIPWRCMCMCLEK
jgi:hypothetical protein